MSTQLFRFQFSRFFSKLWMLIAATLLTSLLTLLFHGLDGQIFAYLIPVLALISGLMLVATLVVGMILFFNTFADSFFGRQASLIRMLPLSRSQIFGTLAVEALTLALIGALMILGWVWMLITTMAGSLTGNLLEGFSHSGIIVAFFLVLFLQATLMLFSGMSGILYGYSRPASKLGWSIGAGIVIYYLFQILTVLAGFLIASLIGWPIFEEDFIPTMEDLRNVLLLIGGCYVVYSLLLGFLCERKIRKGIDIDG